MDDRARRPSLSLNPTAQHKVLALFGLTVAAILGLFVWGTQWAHIEADKERHKAFSDQQYTQAVLIRQSLAGLTDSLIAQAETLAANALPAFIGGSMSDKSLSTLFHSVNAVFPDLKAMAFFDENQALAFSATEDPTRGPAMLAAARRWNRGAEGPDELTPHLVIPPLEIGPENQFMGLVTAVGAPGKPAGRMVLVVDMGGLLTRLTGNLHALLRGDLFLLSEDGTVLYARERGLIGHRMLGEMQTLGRTGQEMLLNVLAVPTGRHICAPAHMTPESTDCEFLSWESVQVAQRRIIITLLAHESDVFAMQAGLSRQRMVLAALLTMLLIGVTTLFYRQRIQRRLEDHNMLLAAQLESTPQGVLIMSSEPRPLLWNSRMLELWNMNTSEGGPDDDDFLKRFAQRLSGHAGFLEQFLESSASPGPEMRGHTVRLADGTILEVDSNHLTDERGRHRGRAWFFSDITERTRTEIARKHNKDLLQTILDNVPSLVYLRDAKSRYVMVNRRYELFFGWQPGTYEGKTPREMLPEEQATSIYLNDAKILKTRKPAESEEVLDFRGRRHVMLSRQMPLFDDSGKVTGIVGITTDITSRKQIEERLRHAVDEFETLFENSMVGTVLIKQGRRIDKVNARFAEMFGYRPEDMIGRTTRFLYESEEHYERAQAKFAAKLPGEEVVKAELQMRHADGTLFWCQASGKALDTANIESGTLWVVDDISDRKKLEQLKEDVDRIVRHDLKSPLTAVIHVPQLLMSDGNLNEDQLALCRELERSGHRMLEMINRSLDLFKMEKGTYRVNPKNLDLVGVILRVLRELNSMILYKSLQIEVLMDGRPGGADSFLVSGEELLCHSIFANLLKNAVEASPEGGRITISMVSGPRRTIAVRNAGAVPESIRGIFFEKYATAGKSGGTGLGTYSAKLSAEAQGGTIAMHTDEAAGTTITVTLPHPTDEPDQTS